MDNLTKVHRLTACTLCDGCQHLVSVEDSEWWSNDWYCNKGGCEKTKRQRVEVQEIKPLRHISDNTVFRVCGNCQELVGVQDDTILGYYNWFCGAKKCQQGAKKR